jgi:hypothetical protein
VQSYLAIGRFIRHSNEACIRLCVHAWTILSIGRIQLLLRRWYMGLVADNSLLERERGMGEGSIDFIMPFFLDAPDKLPVGSYTALTYIPEQCRDSVLPTFP